MSARYLADYMAASESARRTIVRNAKYTLLARVVQHGEARQIISNFLLDANSKIDFLKEEAQRLRDRLADDDFTRGLLDLNADYIDRFSEIFCQLQLPKAEFLEAGICPPLDIEGVRVRIDLRFRVRRLTKTNKVRLGGAMLRYAKGKPLSPEVAAWQSSIIHGYVNNEHTDEGAAAEKALCLTIDAHAGICHPAPGNAAARFKNIRAACQSIAERWDAIQPPPGAVL